MPVFQGKDVSYWVDLKMRADDAGVEHLLNEISELRKQVEFYEKIFREVGLFRAAVDCEGDL